ncbi:thioesterase II family protein [Nocardiopsis baichengensis]|uniref:thioesterase II family protein n=1 Tax=Nocardiopsis baichengensis TaxID=280240 RepID=UPI00034DB130|nr:thioesterase domain-containing protein [Nocardiopsis baichengensis]
MTPGPTPPAPALRERLARLPHGERAELLRRLRGRTPAAPDPGAWFARPSAGAAPALRLFCLPYAGGGGSVFRSWGADLPAGVEVCPVLLPGREARLSEPAHRSLPALVEALHRAIGPLLDVPFAFFGHSMGALIAFELARRLRQAGDPRPEHLFLAAFRAPHLPNPNIRIHHLPDEVIKTVLLKEGTPRQVVEDDAVMRSLLPTLRADLELCDTYDHVPGPPLSAPLSTFGGLQDVRVSGGDLDQWRRHTAARFRLIMLPGSHFFVHSARDAVLAEVSAELETTVTREKERSHDRPTGE